ncbi:hypothetical protein BsWGS_16003 [Bradybaena similaris]
MSRTGQCQVLRPRQLGDNSRRQTSGSIHVCTGDIRSQENVRVPSPDQSSSSVAEDDIDADTSSSTSSSTSNSVSSSEQSLICSFINFRSRDFQADFHISRRYRFPDISPLPLLSWADSDEVWKNMLKKETIYLKNPGLFINHPELHPRMRAIMIDWMSEVCEVYTLHKETFCLAQDFVDRFLSMTKDMPKTQLQLVGVAALFLAAKLEEIYPPKLSEFAYMTDGACTEQDIIRQEMIIVKALKWDLAPMTTNSWLGVFLQVASIEHITDQNLGFIVPQFSSHAFIQLARLCDLSLMDYGSLHFRYSIIAASALYHHTNEHLVADVSGLTWADIYPCVKWMAPFAKAILEVGQSPVKFFKQVPAEDCHNIQAHNVGMALLERALTHQVAFREQERLVPCSLDLSAQLVALLMPPDDDEEDDHHDNVDGIDDNVEENAEDDDEDESTDVPMYEDTGTNIH